MPVFYREGNPEYMWFGILPTAWLVGQDWNLHPCVSVSEAQALIAYSILASILF